MREELALFLNYLQIVNYKNLKPLYREDETKKLLYVVCSRAKKNLYLFSEQGRTTQRGAPLLSTDEILAIDYEYDSLF